MNILTDKIYRINHKDENEATVELSDENHPLFKAHFPTMPVLPGFVHFEIVSELFDIEITKIKKAKFLKTVLPNQTLVYQRDHNKFKVFCQDQEIANFIL
ncbi:MAG: hypothetical protein U9N33_11600 [Campylobacterota bacterium]|nr:hypothetical protein [Campylobacterota bacterium]